MSATRRGLARLSPCFRTNTLKAPPTPHFADLTVQLLRSSPGSSIPVTTPLTLFHPLSLSLSHSGRALAIRFEARREIILLLHLARRSPPLRLRPRLPSLVPSDLIVECESRRFRVIIPGLRCWVQETRFRTAHPAHTAVYRAIFPLAVPWTRCRLCVLLSLFLSFTLFNVHFATALFSSIRFQPSREYPGTHVVIT